MGRSKDNSGNAMVGKIGAVVYVERYGKIYSRSLPSAQKKPATAKQVMYRERFRRVNFYCLQFKKTVIDPIWNPLAAGTPRSGYNLFFTANMPAFTQGGILSDVSQLHFSAGELPGALNMTCVPDVALPLMVHLTWEDDSQLSYDRHNDTLWMVTGSLISLGAQNPEDFPGYAIAPLNTGISRASGAATLQIPLDHTDLWVYFGAQDGRSFSSDRHFRVTP